MDLSIEPAVMTLKAGTAQRLRGRPGQRVTSVRGTLWVTGDADLRDVVLTPGGEATLDPSGRAVVQALGGAALVALEDGVEIEPRAAAPGLWTRLAERLRSARTRYELRGLTDYQLRDIGLSRSEIDCLVR